MRRIITLYVNKKDCCGCSACMNICPKQAISMQCDEEGYIFPEIKHELCIECGKCKKVCAFQNVNASNNKPYTTYAAINKNKSILSSSASGGVFGAVAFKILEKKGVVFGCAYNKNMDPEHVCVDNMIDLKKLQGSKYVQSNIKTSYTQAKQYLEDGMWVLFTGTPCQIAGLKSYLDKDYTNLITIDIICHGVPSVDFFKGYIKYLEDKLKCKIKNFIFRDKTKGWQLMGKVVYEKNGKTQSKLIPHIKSYYYNYFLRGDIYRESCYECKYACASRQGDITMGDYWGIERIHPEVETKYGVSLLLVNSKKGMKLISSLSDHLKLIESDFERAKAENTQLRKPMDKSDNRARILKIWCEGGYQTVAEEYYKKNKKLLMIFRVKMLVPASLKRFLKKML